MKIMSKIKAFVNALLYPVEKHFNLFFSVLLLHALVDLVYFYVWPEYTMRVFFHGVFFSYVLTLPCLLLEKTKRGNGVYKSLVLVVYLVSFLSDLFAHSILDSSLDEDAAAAIMATNQSEFMECVQTHFSLLPCLIGLVVLFLLYKLYKRLSQVRLRFKYAWLGLIAIGAYITFTSRAIHLGGIVGKTAIFSQAMSPVDLSQYRTQPDVTVDSSVQPEHVVMIVGESLSRNHCSIAGYEKETTPLMSRLQKEGLLYNFPKASAPDVHTLQVFQTLISQYRREWKDSVDWFRCTTLPDVLHAAGYKTFWVSNQSKRGVCENTIGQYSDLFSENYFVGNKLAGLKRKNLDEELLPLLHPLLDDPAQHKFYLVHLMGSHFKFSKRYPESFDRFHADEYAKYPSHQCQVLAEYDNSVLYNDSIVYELMTMYENKEAIVFYFSDHGLDLYNSSPDYYGHAKKTEASFHWGQEIPFFVYVTPAYKQRFPERVKQIEAAMNGDFRTDNMFYTIMDLIGAKFNKNDDVSRYTLFQ